jgi:hypothetical protein
MTEHTFTFSEASEMPLPDVLNRYQVLNDRDLMARAIAALQATGAWKADRSIRPADHPPLTAGEALEMLARGESRARYSRHPAQVHHAVVAGATWQQIAAATGRDAGQVRDRYHQWAISQRELREQYPGGTIGMSEDEYQAAVDAARIAEAGE